MPGETLIGRFCSSHVYQVEPPPAKRPGGHVFLERLGINLKEVRIMERFTQVRRRQVGLQIGLMVGLASIALMLASQVGAQVKPGDFITPENAARVKDLVGPGVYHTLERGM